MVEFALVLPLLLVLIVGGLHLGLLIVDRQRVIHTAQETAIHAASAPEQCANAEAVARRIYGAELDDVGCIIKGEQIEVSVTHAFAALLPWLPDRVSATERALVRE